MKSNTAIGIGIGIGMVVAVPLFLFVMNHLFYRGNDGKTYAPVYMRDSEDLKVQVPEWLPDNPASQLTFKDTSYFSKLKRNGSGELFTATFFSKEYNKYFIIKLFDPSNVAVTMYYQHLGQSDLLLTVNKEDMDNPANGTKARPVPVFRFRSIPGETPGELDPAYDVTRDNYAYNVFQYLSYMMPKEEFNKRFLSAK